MARFTFLEGAFGFYGGLKGEHKIRANRGTKQRLGYIGRCIGLWLVQRRFHVGEFTQRSNLFVEEINIFFLR